MSQITITPESPYWAACFDCDWTTAKRLAAEIGPDHLAAVKEAEQMALEEEESMDDYDTATDRLADLKDSVPAPAEEVDLETPEEKSAMDAHLDAMEKHFSAHTSPSWLTPPAGVSGQILEG